MGRRTKSKQRVLVLEKASERCIACGVDCLPGLERCWNCGTALPALWAGASAQPPSSSADRQGTGLAPDPQSGLADRSGGGTASLPSSGTALAPSPDTSAAGVPLHLGGEWYAPDVGAQLARRLGERSVLGGWRSRISSLQTGTWLTLAIAVMAVAGFVGYWVGVSAPGVGSAGRAEPGSALDSRHEAWRPAADPALLPAQEAAPAASPAASGTSQMPAAKAGDPEQKGRARRESAPTKLGAAVYKETCSTCHDPERGTGPAVDRPELWMERFARGKEALYASVREGKGDMKPRGGNPAVGNEELDAAVDYMTDRIIRVSVERAVARMPFAGNGELTLSNSAPPAREEGAAAR